MLFSTAVMGAPLPIGPNDIDTWYTIEDEEPYFSATYGDSPDISLDGFIGEYYQNDFFFLNFSNLELLGNSITEIQGSYIFEDTGFFIGLGYQTGGGSSSYLVSPGYRLAFDDRSYLAFSLDYSDEEVQGLELRAKYCPDAMKLTGWLYMPNGGDTALYLDLAYQIDDELVIGGSFLQSGATSFTVGATWKPGAAVVDLAVNDDGDYLVSGVYYFDDFGVGAQYDGETYGLKAKYAPGDSYFTLTLVPEQDSAPMGYTIGCTVAF